MYSRTEKVENREVPLAIKGLVFLKQESHKSSRSLTSGITPVLLMLCHTKKKRRKSGKPDKSNKQTQANMQGKKNLTGNMAGGESDRDKGPRGCCASS